MCVNDKGLGPLVRSCDGAAGGLAKHLEDSTWPGVIWHAQVEVRQPGLNKICFLQHD